MVIILFLYSLSTPKK